MASSTIKATVKPIATSTTQPKLENLPYKPTNSSDLKQGIADMKGELKSISQTIGGVSTSSGGVSFSMPQYEFTPFVPTQSKPITISETYLNSLKDSQKKGEDSIISSYKALIENANGKKQGITAQADTSFSDTYRTARVQALGNNEALAAMGLAGGAYDSARSGYSESSRVAGDNTLHTALSAVRAARDTALAGVDSQILDFESQKNQDILKHTQSYSDMINKAYFEIEKLNAEQANRDREYELSVASYNNQGKLAAASFNYQMLLDQQRQQNWQSEFNQSLKSAAQSQLNWAAEQSAKATAAAQSQQNWEAQQAAAAQKIAAEQAAKAKADAQKQKNWEAEQAAKAKAAAQAQKNWEAQQAAAAKAAAQGQKNWAAEQALKRAIAFK